MKISVVTPFHRGKQYLPDYFDSLCAQSFRDFEVIFVLADAEDVSDILDKYQSMLRLEVVTLEGKTGVSAARNLGLEKASGEYVYFMDADDYILEHTLERFALHLEEQPNLQLLYGNKKRTWYKRSITLDALRTEQIERWKAELTEAGITYPEDADEATLETLVASVMGDEVLAKENAEDAMADAGEEDNETDRRNTVADNDDSEGYDSEEQGEAAIGARNLDEVESDRLARKNRAARVLISSRKGIKNISVLHTLINREFLLKKNIRFDEEAVFYADLSFMVQVLEEVREAKRVFSSKYYQRRHNDPINLPSIAQQKSDDRFTELLSAYEKAIALVGDEYGIKERLYRKMINYYCNYFAVQLHRSKKTKWKEERFEQMRRIITDIDPKYIKRFQWRKRRLVAALKASDIKKVERQITVYLGKKKLWALIKQPSKVKREMYNHVYKKQPLMENTVLFECFFGGFYSDSPKYIFEQLIKAYPGEYNCVWVYKDKRMKIPFACKQVKRFSLAYYRYLARAKYFVFNNRQPAWMEHRDGMVFLETWHGTPLKRLTFDQEEVLSASPNHKALMYRSSRNWDYLVSPNEFSTEVFKSCFMFDNMMLNTGYPRNDILHKPDKEVLAKQIRAKLGIPEGKKTILYAPTWRDDEFYGHGQYKFTLKLDLQEMKKHLSNEYVVLLRTHYYIADAIDTTGVEDFVVNVCRYNDIAELYLISDILITDYSSVFFDYAGLKRPMLFYTYDLEKYRDDLRGFYIDMETEVPGPLLLTTDDVIDAIENISEVNAKYKERYKQFYKRFCGWEDGHASEKIVDFVFKGKKFDNHDQ